MRYIITLITVLIFSANVSAQKVVLPDGTKVRASSICGNCIPGQRGVLFTFRYNPYAPDIFDNSTDKSIAYSIIGHTYPEDNLLGDITYACAEGSVISPFGINAINKIGSLGETTFDYSRTERLNVNVNAAVNANIDELKKYTQDTSKLHKLEFQIKAAYQKINGKELKIVGYFSRWGLNKDTLEALVKDVNYVKCKDYIANKNKRIITAIGLVKYDITYNETSIDSLASEIQSAVQREGINASLTITFKKQISQALRKVTTNFYQVLMWRSLGKTDLKDE